MIEFGSLEIHNFLSVSEASINLNGRGLVLIEGINKDDPSALSNGAGKSSIVDSISWCLYGVTARGVTGDSVVNLKAGKNTVVRLRMIVDGSMYLIERGRKHHDLKNRVRLHVLDDDDGIYKDLTLGTDRLTQERIDALLGCPADVFNAAIYMGQEAMTDLPMMTDKALKAILEQALQLDKLDDALEVCKQRCGTALDQLETAQAHVDQAHEDIETSRTERDHYATKIAGTKDQLKVADEAVHACVKAYDRLKAKQVATIADLRAMVDGSLEKRAEASKAILAAARAAHHEQDAAFTEKSDKLLEARARLSEQAKALNAQRIALEEGRPCPTCGSVRGDHAHDPASIITITEQYDAVIDKLSKVNLALEDLGRERKEATRKLMADRDEKLELLEAAHAKQQVLAYKIRDAEYELEIAKTKFEGESTKFAQSARYIRDRIKDYSDEWSRHDALVRNTTDMLVDLTNAWQDAKAKYEVLEKVRHVLSRKGFRGEVLDQVTPYLNARTQHYLSQLTDDNITATWSTITQNSAGEYVEDFHIDVAHESGVTKFQALSGGEKRKVRLACAMALQDLIATRAVKPIRLFVADEIDDAIDESGLELLMGLLEQKARDVGTVLVISHNDISDWCRNKVTVVKSGGQSTFV